MVMQPSRKLGAQCRKKIGIPPRRPVPRRLRRLRPKKRTQKPNTRIQAPRRRRHAEQLANTLPVSVTGLLPKRGSFEAAYDMQAFLEKAMAEPANITGVTLDLRIKPIFRAMGFPQQLIDKWFLSLQKLVRYWDIDGFVSPLIASTTGCPEGDCWSFGHGCNCKCVGFSRLNSCTIG